MVEVLIVFMALLQSHLSLFHLLQNTFCPQTRINTGFLSTSQPRVITPTRSCQKFSKQICLWDLVRIIGILFIIQIVEAI